MKPWVEKVILVIVGGLITQIWNKIKSRTMYLDYSVWHQPLGTSVNDNLFGNVQILYNENPMKSLYFSTVIIENLSSKDIENIDINIYCDSESSILVSHGYLDLSPNALNFTKNYQELLEKSKNDHDTLITALGRRDYTIPVINRGDNLKIQLLMTNDRKQPEVYVSCEHKGVKMKFSKNLKDFYGESSKHCARLGSIITLLLLIPLIIYMPSEYHIYSIIAGTLMGLFAMFIGWVFIKCSKTLLRALG